jgi:NADP-dependent 3-hydroxy acid dehydrogenase YdfG
MSDESRFAVVTGGSAGIGKSVCQHLLDAGYEVISLARRAPDNPHPRMHSFRVDLTDAAATAQAVQEIARQFPITTVIHNAGVIRPALLPDVRLEDLDALVNLHLAAAVSLTRPHCRQCAKRSSAVSCCCPPEPLWGWLREPATQPPRPG